MLPSWGDRQRYMRSLFALKAQIDRELNRVQEGANVDTVMPAALRSAREERLLYVMAVKRATAP